ncbi:predicted protein [Arabidopsis lyrata subsp. lyrata]|uniref:Predicted protein n=1 Tax=Arabidopsis lyrata subsp. lyrata TaxID=81972 RepID=D7LP05_ARALL|nr:predicted protein [Arabidopsis lyrata subsp. lyrata]
MAHVDLPARLFADREEPVGDRVNQYFKLHTIKVVLKALQPTELELIRPCFGKLLDSHRHRLFIRKDNFHNTNKDVKHFLDLHK